MSESIKVRTRNTQVSVPVEQEVTINEETSEERLLQFVEEQISKMKKYTDYGSMPGQVGFFELTEALKSYSTVQMSLVSLDVIAKLEHQKKKDEFDEWMSEKYMIAREILNPISLSSQKWASAKEIEFYVRNTWKAEYKKLNEEATNAENRVAFCRRLLDAWKDHLFVLQRLCNNQQTEMTSVKMGME